MKTIKLIGRGAFTRAYLMESGKVLLKSCDPIKECMSLGWFPESPLFPLVERVDIQVYEMEYYPRVSSLKKNLDPDQWEIYKALSNLNVGIPLRRADRYLAVHKAFDTLADEALRDTMKGALDACCNYGTDIGFEISPRNVATKEGKLILLDCFFSVVALEAVRKGELTV